VTNSEPTSRDEKRNHARAQAAAFREHVQKRKRRNRLLIQVGVVVVVLAVAGVIIGVVTTNNHSAAAITAKSTASVDGPKNMGSDGILMTGKDGKITAVRTPAVKAKGTPVATDESKMTSTANIVEFIDYQCPYCNEFETTNLDQIDKWVAAGKATVEIHPLAFLDASSQGTRYSSRAENAAACVANFDPDAFLTVTKALYANQPPESSPGLPNSKLVSILAGAGAGSASIAGCVNGESFKSWVSASTALTISSVFSGNVSTPTVFVNGAQYTGSLTDASVFAAFVDKQKPGTTN
jgi:protein-disulfide isomerase